MRNHPNKIVGAFCIVIMVAAFLVGNAPAQAADSQSKADQLVDTIRHQLAKEGPSRHFGNEALKSSPSGYVSPINKANFNTGSWFAFAIADLASGNLDKADMANAVIADLVFLIDSLENQPEAATLQKTLRSFVRRTSTVHQILREVQDASVSYSSRLGGEQKWYFTSGLVFTDLVVDVALQNDRGVIEGVSKTQGLIKTAPKGTSQDVLDMMGKVVNYAGRTSLAKADYNAIRDGAFSVISIIAA